MDEVVEDFIESPSENGLNFCTKKQLILIAEYYKVDIGDTKKVKEYVKGNLKAELIECGVLEPSSVQSGAVDPSSPSKAGATNLSFEQQKELLLLRLKAEQESERRRQELERAKLDIERQKLELARESQRNADESRAERSLGSHGGKADELSDLRLVPQFNEKDPETFFSLFERLATTRGWSDPTRILLLQCVLTGKAQQAFSALSSVDGADYVTVKAAVLRVYALVPEAYRQRFRSWRRGDKSHLEFMRDLVIQFDSWCASAKVTTFGDLRELILLEQFKNSVSERIAGYIGERGVKTVAEAATLADDYYLTHSVNGGFGSGPREPRVKQPWSDREFKSGEFSRDSDKICNYCHKRGHWKSDCYALKSRSKLVSNVKPVMCVASGVSNKVAEITAGVKPELEAFLPFITKGWVSLVGSEEKVHVNILRDTGAVDSFIVASTLPFSNETSVGLNVPVVGMGLNVLSVPQHKMMLNCDLFQGEVVMGVRPALPLEGVSMILGNDIAGSRVWADVPPPVQVSSTPVCGRPDESELQFPEVFGACAVTRSKQLKATSEEVVAASNDAVTVPVAPWSISQEELVKEQKLDSTLSKLGDVICSPAEVRNNSHCYFLHNDVLMRKWSPQLDNFVGDPVYQVVVPVKFRDVVLQVSHDQSGHLGVRKTYDRVMRYFFWPRLKRDVSVYCKSCHTCQLTSKPNQTLKPVPLCPIPAIGQPFEHLLIDCVGPLPPAKSGASYLLTVMCQSTRYPAAYSLRSITAKSVVKALSQFMSVFGVPRIIQTDQGSNFCSKLFSQVLKQLNIMHNLSSAYHAQSQGALERFHQTLKSMLRSFCVQMQGDWEEALPWMLLAAREVVQESTGFSPNDLVFGHKVRGPLALLQDRLKDTDPPTNLLDFVNCFRYRLYTAQEVAKKRLAGVQAKMKKQYDRRVEHREFLPGDQVLALLPLVTSPFQARYSGPYCVLKKLSELNYLILTPERRSKSQLCHVNLLKPYVSREPLEKTESNPIKAHPVCLSGSPSVVADPVGEDLDDPDDSMVTGRLKNGESLGKLDVSLGHLDASKRKQLVGLIKSFPSLFGNLPTCTAWIKHDIDVSDAREMPFGLRTDHLKGKVKFVWSLVCQGAFGRVGALVSNAPVLAAPRWDREFALEVDAILVGAGAVLLQFNEGVRKPVCFFSKKFNCHQKNYSVIERKTLALVWALQHFDVYVGCGPVIVYSDHNPLTFLSSLQTPNQRLMRWALYLQAYTLDVRHIRGRDNVVADALSRAH